MSRTLLLGAGKRPAAAGTGASILAGAEADVVAFDFTDNSAIIRDTVTPANDYTGAPFSKITFARASTAYSFNSAGLLVSNAVDVARSPDYDPATLGSRGFLIDEVRTNVCLWSDDMTNAAWTKTNTTAAKDQTGPDGVGNSASSLTATAANGTCLQAITLGSSARYQTVYIKRITGTGTVNMTIDNGATWTAVVPTGSWTRVVIPTQTLANPTVGFRIVTSGDAVAVFGSQNEDGAFPTSYIPTTTVAVTRAYDNANMAVSLFNYIGTIGTYYAKWLTIDGVARTRLLIDTETTNQSPVLYGTYGGGGQTPYCFTGSLDADMNTHTLHSSLVANKFAFAYASPDDAAGVVNGGTPVTDVSGTAAAAATVVKFGLNSSEAAQLCGWLQQVMILPRRMSNAELQTLTT